MEWIIDIGYTLGIFALALLILVFFHELGHFLAAKFFGMRVERFSVGFPPRIWGFKKGDTDYCIGATPLGGYVKISGMIDESMDDDYLDEEPKPWEYRSKPVWQRMIVITAGVIFNMLLAVLIFAGIALTHGEERIPIESVGGIYVPDSSLAQQAGFHTGDRIVGINGKDVTYFKELYSVGEILSEDLSYNVIRGGQPVTVVIGDSVLNEMNRQPLFFPEMALPSQVARVLNGSPADSAGMKAGDRVVAVNGDTVAYWIELVNQIQKSGGKPLDVTLLREGETLSYSITPDENNKLGIGAMNPQEFFDVKQVNYGLGGSLAFGVQRTGETFMGILQGFEKMFSGSISVRENLGGPVAIANITKQQTEAGGAVGFWNITALLSVTLAIMNILPIPVLDGGHLLFLVYEGITRREPSPQVRMTLQKIGFLLIIALFIFVTFNDIIRQFG